MPAGMCSLEGSKILVAPCVLTFQLSTLSHATNKALQDSGLEEWTRGTGNDALFQWIGSTATTSLQHLARRVHLSCPDHIKAIPQVFLCGKFGTKGTKAKSNNCG